MPLSTLALDARNEVLKRIPFGQLARIARVNKFMRDVISVEIRRRIGPQNAAAVAAKAVSGRIYYMTRGVIDAAAYMPLALALLPKYRGTKRWIFVRWVRLGLVNCARLVCQDEARYHESTTMNDQTWLLAMLSNPMTHSVKIVTQIHKLDARHFNLLAEMVSVRVKKLRLPSMMLWSNSRYPRYDPFFANRLLAQWGPSPLLTAMIERKGKHPAFDTHGDPLPDDPLVAQ